jgi:cytochrome c oxidase cbb3-type subunit 4
MDMGTIRGLGTVVVMAAFIGLALWVYSPRRKAEFDDARLLPFADEPHAPHPLNRNEQEQEQEQPAQAQASEQTARRTKE